MCNWLVCSSTSIGPCTSPTLKPGPPDPLRRLGYLALLEQDADRATALDVESVVVNREVGDRQGVAASLVGLAAVAEARGQREHAALLLGAAEALAESIETRLLPFDAQECERITAVVRGQLDTAMFASAWAKGRSMTLDQAVAAAWATIGEATKA